jgi:hypothetical protein
MARSLIRVAERNSTACRVVAYDRVRADSTGQLADFLAFVSSSVFSSNVPASKVIAFDEVKAFLDSRSLFQRGCKGDRRAGLRAFRVAQGSWYVPRVRFEALWNYGREFVYGVVNAGGLGADGPFGQFCLVIANPHANAPKAVAVFPANSAERYASGAGNVDGGRASVRRRCGRTAHTSPSMSEAMRPRGPRAGNGHGLCRGPTVFWRP